MLLLSLQDYEFWPGDEIGDYILVEQINYGGESSIWSAYEKSHKQVVVIKFFLIQAGMPQSTINKFQKTITENLDHPNIRATLDTGIVNKIPYLCMKYYPYGSLQDLIDNSTLSLEEVVQFAAQIVNALEFIHEKNMVHRDLKPNNILIDIQRHAYLTDFGLAKTISQSTQVLHTGHGTAPYSSPEQHLRKLLNPKTDIYSLGIMLYNMFTGEMPWRGEIPLALKQLEAKEQLPDPREIVPSLPATLVDALRIITNSDPNERPNTAAEAFGLVMATLNGNPITNISHENGVSALGKILETISPPKEANDLAGEEAQVVLQRGLDNWDQGNNVFKLSATEFVFLDSVFSKQDHQQPPLEPHIIQFMANGSIIHGFNQSFWWQKVDDLAIRLRVCEQVFTHESEEAIERGLEKLLEETNKNLTPEKLTPALEIIFKELALNSVNPSIQDKVFVLLRRLIKPEKQWQTNQYSPSESLEYAKIALSSDSHAVMAAQFIGHIRSDAAVEHLWQEFEKGNSPGSLIALTEINRVAGSLPPSLPFQGRLQIWGELTKNAISLDRMALLKTYAATALACVFGLGFHVYSSYRLPELFSRTRILSALQVGLLFGPLIGLGIFLTQLVNQRIQFISRFYRILISVVVGSLIVNFSFVYYNILFLDLNPSGWFIFMGSVILILGFSLGIGLFQKKTIRALVSTIGVGLGISLSWRWAINVNQIPMLYYEISELQKSITMILIFSLVIGIVPHIFDSLENKTE